MSQNPLSDPVSLRPPIPRVQTASHPESAEMLGPGHLDRQSHLQLSPVAMTQVNPIEWPTWELTAWDHCALVAMVKRDLRMISLCPLVPGISGAQSCKRVLKAPHQIINI